MILQIYLRGGNAMDMDVHAYDIALAEDGSVKDLQLTMYGDSRAKLVFVNPTEIIAIIAVDPVERHPEVTPGASA